MSAAPLRRRVVWEPAPPLPPRKPGGVERFFEDLVTSAGEFFGSFFGADDPPLPRRKPPVPAPRGPSVFVPGPTPPDAPGADRTGQSPLRAVVPLALIAGGLIIAARTKS